MKEREGEGDSQDMICMVRRQDITKMKTRKEKTNEHLRKIFEQWKVRVNQYTYCVLHTTHWASNHQLLSGEAGWAHGMEV